MISARKSAPVLRLRDCPAGTVIHLVGACPPDVPLIVGDVDADGYYELRIADYQKPMPKSLAAGSHKVRIA